MRGNKGNIFTVGVLLFFLVASVYAIIALGEKYDISREKVSLQIGDYQAALIRSVQQGEEVNLYVRQAGKLAGLRALDSFSSQGARTLEAVYGEGDGRFIEPECGRYVYNKWSNSTSFCPPPDGEAVYLERLNRHITPMLREYADDLEIASSFTSGSDGLAINADGTYTIPIYIIETYEEMSRVPSTPVEVEGNLGWPTDSFDISSCFGNRWLTESDKLSGKEPDWHDGIDLSVPEGTPVRAVLDGEVVGTCEGYCGGFGGNIVLRHANDIFTRYSHLSSVRVSNGEEVGKDQVIGLSGNTGRSTGAHLDFKFYDSSNYVNVKEPGRNPLCIYPESVLERLESDADSCETKYGEPVRFTHQSPRLASECQGIFISGEDSENLITGASHGGSHLGDEIDRARALENEGNRVKVGDYQFSPSYNVSIKTGLDPAGNDGLYSEIVAWANEVWEACTESPVDCMDTHMNEYNSDPYANFTIGGMCEDNTVFYSIVEEFEACMNNGRYNCDCRLDLSRIYSPEDYEITFSGGTIEMTTPESASYSPGAIVSFYNSIPASIDFGDIPDELKLRYEDGNHYLDTTFGSFEYPEIIWYKPRASQMMMVKEGTGRQCQERRDTFPICAETRDNVVVIEDGKSYPENLKVKFSLQLRDESPPAADSVETIPVEKSNEGIVESVKEAALERAVQVALGPIGPLVMEFLPERREGTFRIVMDIPEDADISGFEVYCSVGTPLGSVTAESAQGMVTVDNPRLNSTILKDSLDIDEEDILDAAGRTCDYVRAVEEDGREILMKKIKSVYADGKASFSLSSCGGNPLEQLASQISKTYCYKFVPVDSQGNRNENAAVTTCESFESIRNRVLEALGVQELAEPYLEVADKASMASDAMRSGELNKIIAAAGELGIETGEWGEEILTDTVKEIYADLSEEDYEGAAEIVIEEMAGEERVRLAREVLENPKKELIEMAVEKMTDEEKKEALERMAEQAASMKSSAQEAVAEAVKLYYSNQPKEVAERILEELGSERLLADIERLRNANLRQGIEELTQEQIDELIERVADGRYGRAAQAAIIAASDPGLADTIIQIEQAAREMGAAIKAEVIAREDEILNEALKEYANLQSAVENMKAGAKSRVYAELESRFKSKVDEKTQEALETVFGVAQCTGDPLMDFRNAFGQS